MKIVSIIPIKMNNERLPGKNTKLLGKYPLLYYIQKTLLSVLEINERYVFCSDQKICDYLLPGIKYLNRSPELDKSTSNFTQIFESFFQKISADIYVYAHATAPFVQKETIKECIQMVISQKYDSSFCAVKIQDYLWSKGKPLNLDPKNLPRSQDLTPIYRETSGVYVFTKEVFDLYHQRIGRNPFIKEVTFRESVDINTPQDFQLAEMVLKNKNLG